MLMIENQSVFFFRIKDRTKRTLQNLISYGNKSMLQSLQQGNAVLMFTSEIPLLGVNER